MLENIQVSKETFEKFNAFRNGITHDEAVVKLLEALDTVSNAPTKSRKSSTKAK